MYTVGVADNSIYFILKQRSIVEQQFFRVGVCFSDQQPITVTLRRLIDGGKLFIADRDISAVNQYAECMR